MKAFAGSKDYRVIAGDGWVSQAAWQDTAYFGEVIDNAMTPEVIKAIQPRLLAVVRRRSRLAISAVMRRFTRRLAAAWYTLTV
ncbi:hypothetical protein AA11826_0093 [Komagataeibacter oboediens DSM 11826]|nr:hypothetical protein AA11826_0093 [Komagataeibacter oboediens DSM 11826]